MVLKLRRLTRTFINAILPQTAGAVIFKRVLDSAGSIKWGRIEFGLRRQHVQAVLFGYSRDELGIPFRGLRRNQNLVNQLRQVDWHGQTGIRWTTLVVDMTIGY